VKQDKHASVPKYNAKKSTPKRSRSKLLPIPMAISLSPGCIVATSRTRMMSFLILAKRKEYSIEGRVLVHAHYPPYPHLRLIREPGLAKCSPIHDRDRANLYLTPSLSHTPEFNLVNIATLRRPLHLLELVPPVLPSITEIRSIPMPSPSCLAKHGTPAPLQIRHLRDLHFQYRRHLLRPQAVSV
jgi:hypothetical protein